MPDPSNYDNEDDWMAACVPAVMDEGKPQDQAVAQCLSMWRDRDKATASAVTRAYSIITIKSVDSEKREIEGFATTPEVDRAGDIVEPMGGKFKLPIDLLWQHQSREPAIGRVIAAKASKDGITIKARLAKIDEPGELKNMVDKAWQAVKHGLVRGLSIGFKPLEYSFMEDGDGIRYSAWDWLELSLVTIPANQSATILAIKSLSRGDRAASGTSAARKSPGVSGKPVVNLKAEDKTMSKTIADQIKDLETTRAAKAAEMSKIMQKSVDEGRSTDAAEQEEFDTLQAEVEALDADLKRFRQLEAINKAAARPVTPENAGNLEDGATARGGGTGRVHITSPSLEKGIRFARLVKCLGLAQGNRWEAFQIAKAMYPDDGGIQNALEISAKGGIVSSDFIQKQVGGMMTGHSLGAGLVGDETRIFADFVEWLRPQTLIGRFGTDGFPALRRVPFRTALISQTSGATGYWTGEGAGKGVTNWDAERTHLEELKAAAIAVASKELLQRSSPNADALIRDELGRAVRERVNLTFIDPSATAVAGVSPASITSGAPTQPSSGTDADAVRADLAQLIVPFIAANNPPEEAVLIMTSARAMHLGLMRNDLGQREFPDIGMRGGTLEGIPVMVTQLVPDTGSPSFGSVVLVNASDIWLAEEGGLTVSMSDQASLEMTATPTQHVGGVGSPDTPIGSTMVSLWQTNSVGFLVEWTINWARRRASGVQVLSGVAWTSTPAAP